jgi:hypothetical protein
MARVEEEGREVGDGLGIGSAGGSAGVEAGSPVLAVVDIESGVAKFEGMASAMGRTVPVPAAMPEIHRAAPALGPVAFIGPGDFIDDPTGGIRQGEGLAGIGEDAVPADEETGHVRMPVGEGRGIGRDHEVCGRFELGAWGKGEPDSAGELPTGEVDRVGAAVDEFEPFFVGLAG